MQLELARQQKQNGCDGGKKLSGGDVNDDLDDLVDDFTGHNNDERDDVDDDDDDDLLNGASAMPVPNSAQNTRYLKEAIEADRYWERYLANNDTVVARTFQGLFKNTVICAACKYPSVTFEPFMYLPVPLPNAVLKQIEVTLVSVRMPVTKFLLDLTQADNIGNLKQEFVKLLREDYADVWPKDADLSDVCNSLQVVEVYDHHISRIIEDWTFLRHLVNDRSVCIIETAKVQVDNDDEKISTGSEKQTEMEMDLSPSAEANVTLADPAMESDPFQASKPVSDVSEDTVQTFEVSKWKRNCTVSHEHNLVESV